MARPSRESMLHSFRIRLIIAFLALFAAVSVAVSFAGMMLREQQVRAVFDEELHLRARLVLDRILREPVITDAVVAGAVRELSSSLYFREGFVQVYNDRNEPIARSPNLGDKVLPLRRPFEDRSMDGVIVDGKTVHDLPSGPTRMRGLRIRFDGTDGHKYLAIVSANSAYMYESIRATRWLFIGSNLGGLAAAAAAAWFVTGAMSRRLTELVEQIEKVGPDNLAYRIEVHDRDEISDLANHINAALDRLKAGFDTQERFIHDASHELKTPVATVQAEAQALLLSDPTRTELLDFVKSTNDEMRRLGRLTEALLLLTRSDDKVLLNRFVPQEVSETVIAAMKHLSTMATDHQVRLTVETSSLHDALFVRCDPDLLEAMLANLIRNAIRFSPRGGQVAISIKAVEGDVEIATEDQGPGIPEDVLPRLFDPFFESSQSRVRRGAGLGLAIASTVVRLHGGGIRVENRDGGGARFVVKMPRYQEQAPVPAHH